MKMQAISVAKLSSVNLVMYETNADASVATRIIKINAIHNPTHNLNSK
jgi:hypothetical protein